MSAATPSDTRPAAKRIVHFVGDAVRGGCETNCATFIQHAPGLAHHVCALGQEGEMSAEWRRLGATVAHQDLLRGGWMQFHAGVRALWRDATMEAAILWSAVRVPLVVSARGRPARPFVIHAGNPFVASRRVRMQFEIAEGLMGAPDGVRIVACSRHVADSLAQAPFFRRFPIEACLNPILVPRRNAHDARPLRTDDEMHVGMVARLDPIKDHPTLLRAIALLRARFPRLHLHLAGDGDLRPSLEALARELGIGEAVTFHGLVTDVRALLQRLDLFAYATTEREGMGNALAEALSEGVPSVVSDLSMMREVVGEPPAATCVPARSPEAMAAAIATLLLDQAGRSRLSAAAYARAQQGLSAPRAVAQYLQALGLAP